MANRYDGEEKRSLLSQGISFADLISIATSLVTAIGIGAPLLIWGGKMDARMQAVESRQERSERIQAVLDTKQDVEREQIKRDVKEEVKEINKKLDVILQRVK